MIHDNDLFLITYFITSHENYRLRMLDSLHQLMIHQQFCLSYYLEERLKFYINDII